MEIINQKEKDFVKNIWPKIKRYVPSILVGLVIAINFALAAWSLFPRTDSSIVEEGKKRLQSLDITFSTKTLNTLKQTKTPVDLDASGGRDPFSNF
jgi:hypothetical protein